MQSKVDISKLPLTCNHWGAYRVETQNGRVKELHPFEHDQNPSPIGRGIVDVLYSDNRVYAPMVRKVGWIMDRVQITISGEVNRFMRFHGEG